MVNNLHTKLSESVPEYRAWHQKKYVSVIHLCLLMVFGTLFAQALVTNITLASPDTLTAAAANSQNNRPSNRGVVLGSADDHILVKFKSSTGQSRRDAILADKKLKKKADLADIGAEVLSIDPSDTPDEVVQSLLADDPNDIEYAEVDQLIQPSAIPNDPSFSQEWNKTIVNAPAAWDTVTGSSVLVAVVDTGVDCTHPDLAADCVPGWNFYDNNSNTTDVYGHGTAVAGVLAAIGNNSVGGVGTVWNAKIMPLRISAPDGSAYTSTIAQAITYAADHGAKVVNNSYNAASQSAAVRQAGDYLYSKGGILVTAAGNSGTNDGVASNDPDYLSVSATDGNDNLYSWSDYGADIDVSAPGCSPVTTANGGGYEEFCGTSNASPEAAGLVALMFSENPSASPQTILNDLYASAHDLGTPGWDQYYGWGRIDAGAAIAMLAQNKAPADTQPPSVPQGVSASAQSSTQVSVSWKASTDNVGVTGYTLYRNGTKLWNGSGTGYVDTSAQPQTTYSYTVSAYDAAGNASAQSSAANVTTPAPPPPVDTTPPSVPAGITVTVVSSTQINIAWNASTDNVAVTGYTLYRNGTKLWSGTNTSYNDTSVKPQTSYSYTITAYDAAGNTSAQSASVSGTTPAPPADTTPPSVPGNVTASAPSSTQVNVGWSASTDNVGVTGYSVYRNGTKVASVATNGYIDTSVSPSTSYSYTVSASDAAGNTSAQSSTASVTTPGVSLSITTFSVTTKTATTATITWTTNMPSTGAVSFGSSPQSLPQNVSTTDTGTKHTATLVGLSKNTKYSYQINAQAGGTSVHSQVSSFKTSPH